MNDYKKFYREFYALISADGKINVVKGGNHLQGTFYFRSEEQALEICTRLVGKGYAPTRAVGFHASLAGAVRATGNVYPLGAYIFKAASDAVAHLRGEETPAAASRNLLWGVTYA